MADNDETPRPQPVPPDRRRRAEDQQKDEPATWGGEGGAGDYTGGPVASPGEVSRDPGHNPELM